MPIQTRSARKSGAAAEVAQHHEPEAPPAQTPGTTRKRRTQKAAGVAGDGPSSLQAAVQPHGEIISQGALLSHPEAQPEQPEQPINPSEYIAELKRRFQPPKTAPERFMRFLHTVWFQTDFILGAYMFDGWEVLLVYPIFLVALLLVAGGVYRQGSHAVQLIHELMDRYQVSRS